MITETKISFFSGLKLTWQECHKTFREGGLKALFRRYGWKIFAVFFLYYLVRDLILYVLIPALFARHFLM